MRIHYMTHGGYSATEMKRIEKVFQKYDADSNGLISPNELGLLIKDFFPVMTPRLRKLLDEMMQETTANSNGSLDFQDFVRVMSQFQDLQNHEKAEKARQAAEETGFSQDEIKDFSEMFMDFKNITSREGVRNELSFTDVVNMLSNICQITDRQTGELQEIFQEAAKKYRASIDVAETIDFPEFLWMMDRLLRINFAGIKEKIGWQGQGQG